tara:strand:- start:126 stop:365 length:240 start_codon:yes stop_codon:yes gene_type:complete
MQMLIIFIFSFVLVAGCGNNNNYKQYVIEETSFDSTKVLNSLEVRAFFYNYNVCESEFSSILISKRKKLNDEWKNHIEQ